MRFATRIVLMEVKPDRICDYVPFIAPTEKRPLVHSSVGILYCNADKCRFNYNQLVGSTWLVCLG